MPIKSVNPTNIYIYIFGDQLFLSKTNIDASFAEASMYLISSNIGRQQLATPIAIQLYKQKVMRNINKFDWLTIKQYLDR